MALEWSNAARRDLARIYAFHAAIDEAAAAKRIRLVLAGVRRLAVHPRLGAAMPEFEPREVRRIVVGDFEVRYELRDEGLFVLRVWHVREDR